MRRLKKYRAAILPYVLLITLAGGIVVSSIMLRFYLSLKESDLLIRQWMIEKDLNSALIYGMYQDYSLAEWNEVPFATSINSSASYQNSYWGVFGITKAEINRNNVGAKKVALWGRKTNELRYSLYLAELKQHFTVCGTTRIEGPCYIPESGIRNGYIEGSPFSGSIPDHALLKHSNRELPALDENFWKGLCKRIWQKETESSEIILSSIETDTSINSFFDPTLRILQRGPILLSHGLIEGNVIVESQQEIIVKPGVQLKGVLLIAPKITIESHNGSYFQAFAREEIIVKENSELIYPSALCLIRDKNYLANTKQETKLIIDLEKNCKVKGILLGISEHYEPGHPLLIRIGEGCEVEGEVYSGRMAEVRGIIKGSLSCEEFYLQTHSSSYKNHLLNAGISLQKRNPEYSGLPFKSGVYEPSIIQYLK